MASQDEFDALKAEVGRLKEKSGDEAHKTALDHAWAHFAYHANQRLVTFRFYLAVVAIFIAAYLKLMSDGIILISSAVALLGLVFSYVFLRLDLRNKDLIELSEAVLIKEENNLQSKVLYEEINIIGRSNSVEFKRKLLPNSYRQSLKFLFILMIFLFAVGVVVPHCPDIATLFGKKVGEHM